MPAPRKEMHPRSRRNSCRKGGRKTKAKRRRREPETEDSGTEEEDDLDRPVVHSNAAASVTTSAVEWPGQVGAG